MSYRLNRALRFFFLLSVLAGVAGAAPQISSALLVLAHPDDETMMASTLALFYENGIDVHVLYATAGEGGNIHRLENGKMVEMAPPSKLWLATLRRRQVTRALRMLGVKSYAMLDEPDAPYEGDSGEPTRDPRVFLQGGVWNTARLEREIIAAVERVKPDIVLTLSTDSRVHAHHQAMATLVSDLFGKRKLPNVKQVYGVEETSWYPPGTFTSPRALEKRKSRFVTDGFARSFGRTFRGAAARSAREHEGQPPGMRGEILTEEVFVPLSQKTADPLRELFGRAKPLPLPRSDGEKFAAALIRALWEIKAICSPNPRDLGEKATTDKVFGCRLPGL